MGRIRILSDDVANKIAAGEVVERPASVLKELLENSLDAGATQLRVEVSGGGRRLIRIADNGSGMLHDDAMLAFERHATSKLSNARDLLGIATLGFRGEALPSIASVSRLVLETRSPDELTGTRVEIAGGKIIACDETALAPGTQITVRDLFYNVPARKKFLRSDQTELAHIASLVTHYSLAHPDKTFTLTSDERELLGVNPVEQFRDRVYQVFGSQTLDELVDLGSRERAHDPGPEGGEPHIFRLRGFVSRPQVQKANRNSLYLFVNGRLIRDRLLLHAISQAYYNLIPPSSYPFALLFIDCPPEEVDVNVHPSKTEVRFRASSFVHDFVRDGIRGALVDSKPISAIPLPVSAQPAAGMPFSEFSQAVDTGAWQGRPSEMPVPVSAQPFTLRQTQAPPPRFDFSGGEIPPAPNVQFEPNSAPPPAAPIPDPSPATAALRIPVPDTHGGFPPEVLNDLSQSMTALADLRPLGQLHDSFILAAGRDGLWIIDQHVAHERILFERILRQRAAGRVETQRLLLPMVIQLTPAQQIDYDRIAAELDSVGFETEPFGNRTIAVKAAPAAVGPADIERIVYEILEIADREYRRVSMDDLRRAMAASIACRAAIKINMRLDQAKMESLLGALALTECPMSCPHGRPIALRYTLRDILKGFHRI
ncbi:MAG TPA: DNA mismatch repair endonuclease MutL [Bryobacteraceae bacterium]|nr:DNA mismatch repair endonuclease MutL [Bryobacteraceae bacterium]